MFGFDKMFGSLTLSPIQTAINEAKRMAQRHFEAGGTVRSLNDEKDADGAADFVVPSDVELITPIASAIEKRLRAAGCSQEGSRRMARQAIEAGADGRVVIPAALVKRLGNGEFKRGRADLERLVSDLRVERLLRTISRQRT
jgi:hypothetical protein